MRVLRAKFRPHLPSEESLQYRPTQGRDTSSGALVATKDYLHSLENNLLGLVHHLQQRTSNDTQREGNTLRIRGIVYIDHVIVMCLQCISESRVNNDSQTRL